MASSPSPTLSRTSTGFSVRKRKPRMAFASSASRSRSRIGVPASRPSWIRRSTTSSRSAASRSAWRAVPAAALEPLEPALGHGQVGEDELEVEPLEVARRVDAARPGAGWPGPRTRGRRGAAHPSRAAARGGRPAAPRSRPGPPIEAGGAGRSTYVTSAWTIFFGLKISARRSSRSSGTLTTPTLSVTPPKPPVSAWPRVSVLKTVVLPDPASPTMAICIGRS